MLFEKVVYILDVSLFFELHERKVKLPQKATAIITVSYAFKKKGLCKRCVLVNFKAKDRVNSVIIKKLY